MTDRSLPPPHAPRRSPAPYEIMAPVGSRESLAAALRAGADSVYFGVEALNMRALSSKAFRIDDLGEIAERCRTAGVRSYLTVNTVLYDEDLPLMRRVLDRAKAEGVSAAIISDAAALLYARSIGLEAHLSTQLNISNVEALRFYAAYADVAVLARELTLEQTRAIAEAVEREGKRADGEDERDEFHYAAAPVLGNDVYQHAEHGKYERKYRRVERNVGLFAVKNGGEAEIADRPGKEQHDRDADEAFDVIERDHAFAPHEERGHGADEQYGVKADERVVGGFQHIVGDQVAIEQQQDLRPQARVFHVDVYVVQRCDVRYEQQCHESCKEDQRPYQLKYAALCFVFRGLRFSVVHDNYPFMIFCRRCAFAARFRRNVPIQNFSIVLFYYICKIVSSNTRKK